MNHRISGNVKSVLIMAVVIGVIGFSIFGRRSVDDQLVATASQINKRCPIQVDGATRLDRVAAEPGKRFIYSYTIMNADAASVDTEQLVEYQRPQLVAAIRTSSEMKILRDHGVTLVYVYNDASAVRIASIEIGPDDYR